MAVRWVALAQAIYRSGCVSADRIHRVAKSDEAEVVHSPDCLSFLLNAGWEQEGQSISPTTLVDIPLLLCYQMPFSNGQVTTVVYHQCLITLCHKRNPISLPQL